MGRYKCSPRALGMLTGCCLHGAECGMPRKCVLRGAGHEAFFLFKGSTSHPRLELVAGILFLFPLSVPSLVTGHHLSPLVPLQEPGLGRSVLNYGGLF